MRILLRSKFAGGDMVFDMRKDRAAHRKVRRTFQPQQAGQHSAKAAGIEDKSGLDRYKSTLLDP